MRLLLQRACSPPPHLFSSLCWSNTSPPRLTTASNTVSVSTSTLWQKPCRGEGTGQGQGQGRGRGRVETVRAQQHNGITRTSALGKWWGWLWVAHQLHTSTLRHKQHNRKRPFERKRLWEGCRVADKPHNLRQGTLSLHARAVHTTVHTYLHVSLGVSTARHTSIALHVPAGCRRCSPVC